jgi:hypothetical protein
MEHWRTDMSERTEASMEAALKRFGWECGSEFWHRYHTDPWVFNLANAVEMLTESIAATAEEQTNE